MWLNVSFTLKKLFGLVLKCPDGQNIKDLYYFCRSEELHNNILLHGRKEKISFIINPISGTQGKEQVLKWIDERLDKEKYAQEVVYTERAGHAVEIASQKAREGVHAVVAIGGDGTINEIARSLVHTQTALGIIPCGSGNGLARHLQIPMEPKKAIDIINEGLIDVIDYGKINEVPFFVLVE